METDILNPNAASVLNPDYPYQEIDPEENWSRFRPRSGGAHYERRIDGLPRSFQLTWSTRPQADMDLLRQWAHQYRGDFFSFYDLQRGRYYSGNFVTPITLFATEGNEMVSAAAVFQEIAGLPLNAYYGAAGADWVRDAVFKYPRDGFGNDLPKKTGAWTYAVNANAKKGSDFTSLNTNVSDMMEVEYWGYGFRYWARKGPDLGIGSISCTAKDGTVELAATNIDHYAAGAAAAAVLQTKYDLKLGWHRVTMLATNTKNAASSAKTLPFDTLEVMK